MSDVTTLIAWLVPCLVVFLAFVAWRIYVYRTRGPFVPSIFRRNVFARTNSFLPRTLSFSSNRDIPVASPTAIAVRQQETQIDMSEQQQKPIAPIPPNGSAAPQVPIPVTQEPTDPGSSSQPSKPASPAITRLLSMQ